MKAQAILTALASLPVALGHGVISSPSPRVIGSGNLAKCGTGANKVLASDKYGPIENAAAKVDSGYDAAACHLFFCKGYQFEDNTDRVQKYSAGQVVNFLVDIEARHTGYANVSVVDLASQTVIGKPLFNWPVYTNNSLGPPDWPKNETNFDITIPTDLGTRCSVAGKCAIQWWWYAFNVQTYESCVDFVVA
ncbi:hypothetical protein P691DRAFT_282874 [Macrolepiota fuliginosa MF-IS2]|uniref:Chitin-binding type-4 domain-containing protein n=1 Tax=Macrolepiota fuliginosa MF-IS2 TaxID=1400762 RepID=A0A9P5X606_9AGAR|nr:hypothetical protein P691DRAFT_282874 [Macrolepiota fuliginosa MF-IS2]